MRPKKSLGQHFLKDNVVLHKIADAIPAQPDERLVEIGPGEGALTRLLYSKYDDLHLIELDDRVIPQLTSDFPDAELLEQDVLKTNWNELKPEGRALHVVGNLPYYITSPILFSVLDQRALFSSAVFMIQKEVAERIVAEPGNKTYGILSVQLQMLSRPEKLFDVPPQAFTPPPNVDSSVIRLTFPDTPLGCQPENLKRVVRTAFNQRRKKLSNAFKPVLDNYIPEAIDLDKRAERIPPKGYEMLTAELERNDIL